MRKRLLLTAVVTLACSVVMCRFALADDPAPSLPEGYWDLSGDERLPLIQQMIEDKGMCWKAGHTGVSDLSDEQKQHLLGGQDDELWATKLDPVPLPKSDRDLPAVFDWRSQLKVTYAENQANCGSCWLHGPVAALEAAVLIYEDQRLDLSEQQILSCVSYGWGCDGGQASYALNHMETYGSVLESCMPYQADDTVPCTEGDCEVITHIDDYFAVPLSTTDIKNAIYTYGPVSAGIYAFDNLSYYQEGCYENVEMHSTNHVICIVGWDDTQCDGSGAWLIKNSWGVNWGMDGFGYIKYGTTGIGRGTYRLAYTPKMHLLRYGSYAVDVAKGDGNGFLDPGETAHLSVTLVNDGKGAATGVTGVLRTTTPGVTILDSTAAFTDMAAESAGFSVAPHFEISIDGGFSAGEWIEFQLALSTDTYSSAVDFPVYVGEFTEMLMDDFETDQGWTVGAVDDDATEGIWERVVPIEKLYSTFTGDVVQPGKDHTPYSGTMCFVTENSPLGTKQRIGDVDGGKTTLLSPIVDLSGYDAAVLSYERFYTNNTIATQTDYDPFEVDVSNDGGANWTNVETITLTPTDREYHRMIFDLAGVVALTDQMQIRFVAQDIGPYNSVVEAVVDDIEIRGFGGLTATASGAIPLRAPRELSLTQNVPNPFNPETVISFGLPGVADVDVSIYNIRGQRVRQLVDDRMSAGFHSVPWDGRDENGVQVSSGVYFYRLSTPEGSMTRRMALVK